MLPGFLGAAFIGAIIALLAAYGAAQGRKIDGPTLGTQALVGALGSTILGALIGHLVFHEEWHHFFQIATWIFGALGSLLAVVGLQMGYFNKFLPGHHTTTTTTYDTTDYNGLQ
ncbi:MAG: hypothetical protein QM632_02400 [Micrococcaceae bacterium]